MEHNRTGSRQPERRGKFSSEAEVLVFWLQLYSFSIYVAVSEALRPSEPQAVAEAYDHQAPRQGASDTDPTLIYVLALPIGISSSSKLGHGATPLQIAGRHPSSPTGQRRQPAEYFPIRPLHFDTRKGHDETVQRLVKNQASVNPPTLTKRTAYQLLPMKSMRETCVLCWNMKPQLGSFRGLMDHSAQGYHYCEGWLDPGILSGSICLFVGSSANPSAGPTKPLKCK